MGIPCTPLVHGLKVGGGQGASKVSRSRHEAAFVWPLSIPKLLILQAKGSRFSSSAVEFAKQRVRRGCGLGGQVRPEAPMERGRAVELPN